MATRLVPDDPPEDGFREFRQEDVEQSIPARFEEQAARRPEAVAVLTCDVRLTYGAVNAGANRLAHAILAAVGEREEPVALLCDQGVEAIIAILGSLKAGKFYVPLDPRHPETRLAALLEDAGAGVILTTERHAAAAARLGRGVRAVMTPGNTRPDVSRENPALRRTPDQLAYLFYTSGSTGQPKGVIDTHRNVLHNVLRYTNNLRIAPGDRLSLLQQPGFSGTVSSLFAALLNGATVCPFALRDEGLASLASWLNECGVTVYHSVPSIFRGFLHGGLRFPAMRVVRLEGDQALPTDVDLFRTYFEPSCVLAVGLGATETGLSCQYLINARATPPGGVVPVGYAAPGITLTVADAEGRDLGFNRTGEIIVRSRFLAIGYWKQPELTHTKFMPVPGDPASRAFRTGDLGRLRDDGCLEFLGRIDFQPKVRGERIDTADVEAALTRAAGVREAVVVIREDVLGEPRLVAYLTASSRPAPGWDDLRTALASTLPDVMIPTACVLLEELPVDANGKVDRRALPPPPARTTEFAPPRDDLETELVALWENVLNRRPVGINDRLGDLGGDSLGAAIIAMRVEQAFNTRLPAASLSQLSTVADLAGTLRDKPRASAVVPLRVGGKRPPLFLVHDHYGRVLPWAEIVRHLGSDQPCYALQDPVEPRGVQGWSTLEEMAAFYVDAIIRTQPGGPYSLAGECFGGVVAFEIARQLAGRGERIGLLAIMRVTPYDFPSLLPASAASAFAQHGARRGMATRLQYYAERLRVLSWRERMSLLRSRAEFARPYDRQWWSRLTTGSGAAGGASPPAAAEVYTAMFSRYRPRPFPGRLVVFLSANEAKTYTVDPRRDWQGLARDGVDVELFKTEPSGLFKKPQAEKVAERLEWHLRTGEGGGNEAPLRTLPA